MHETSSHANDVCRSLLSQIIVGSGITRLRTIFSRLFVSTAWRLTTMPRSIGLPLQHRVWDLSVCLECHLRQLRHSGVTLRTRRTALASSFGGNAEPGNVNVRRSFTSRPSLARATRTRNACTPPSRTRSRSLTTSTSVSNNHPRIRYWLTDPLLSCQLLLMASPGTPGPPSQVHHPSRFAEELSRLEEKILYLNYRTAQAVCGASCALGLRPQERRSWSHSLEK